MCCSPRHRRRRTPGEPRRARSSGADRRNERATAAGSSCRGATGPGGHRRPVGHGARRRRARQATVLAVDGAGSGDGHTHWAGTRASASTQCRAVSAAARCGSTEARSTTCVMSRRLDRRARAGRGRTGVGLCRRRGQPSDRPRRAAPVGYPASHGVGPGIPAARHSVPGVTLATPNGAEAQWFSGLRAAPLDLLATRLRDQWQASAVAVTDGGTGVFHSSPAAHRRSSHPRRSTTEATPAAPVTGSPALRPPNSPGATARSAVESAVADTAGLASPARRCQRADAHRGRRTRK